MFGVKKNIITLNSFASGLLGITGWRNENVIHIQIEIDSLILAGIILTLTAAVLLVHNIIRNMLHENRQNKLAKPINQPTME